MHVSNTFSNIPHSTKHKIKEIHELINFITHLWENNFLTSKKIL